MDFKFVRSVNRFRFKFGSLGGKFGFCTSQVLTQSKKCIEKTDNSKEKNRCVWCGFGGEASSRIQLDAVVSGVMKTGPDIINGMFLPILIIFVTVSNSIPCSIITPVTFYAHVAKSHSLDPSIAGPTRYPPPFSSASKNIILPHASHPFWWLLLHLKK